MFKKILNLFTKKKPVEKTSGRSGEISIQHDNPKSINYFQIRAVYLTPNQFYTLKNNHNILYNAEPYLIASPGDKLEIYNAANFDLMFYGRIHSVYRSHHNNEGLTIVISKFTT